MSTLNNEMGFFTRPEKSFSEAMKDAWKAAQSGRSPMEAHFETDSLSEESARQRFEALNAAGRFFYGSLSIIVLYLADTTTLPYVYADDPDALTTRRWVFYYIFINLTLNYLLVIFQLSKYKPDALPTVAPKEWWKYCDRCKDRIPTRAHHCPLCFACILRRDHHCFFAGVCISYNNQRYFVVALTYILVGCLYSLWLSNKYLSGTYRAMFSSEWYYFLPPVMLYDFVFGIATIKVLLICVIGFFSFSAGLTAAYYLTMQILLIIRGQTTHEFGKGIITYRRGLKHNIESVFGPICLVPFYFIFPVVYCVKPKGNGLEWETVNGKKV
ncbi:palmitoyltransferase ZDHHC22-like [Lingula anatina]|uniref:Palmitoyltransferase n=1 Tax=Lingula anatina TaxID=7574 RepID=A0A2R2MJB1_LINAN|nr:palmitoyltransferase ZDHHC22-like [Lingula anatina]|eukprot:XP_023930298.1 palmitoyltransferase ZDHHC22-like [Lingula anatina]